MRVPSNLFKKRLVENKPQIGIWSSLAGNVSAEVIAPSGYDWVVVDMEHSPNDLATVLSQLQVFEAYPTQVLVRLSWNDPILVKKLLDVGVQGLIFPMIQTVQEAEQAVAATRYPPRGIRGVASSTRATRFGRVDNYADDCEKELVVVVQLETQQALKNAQAIAAVDGVDAVFFGPADIAADLGVVGQPQSQLVWDLIDPIANRLIKNKVALGTLVLDAEFAIGLLQQGYQFVACGMDTALLARASDALLTLVKEGVTDKS